MPARVLAAVTGVVFGFTLCWVRFSDPDAIRGMLLFENGYLWLVFVAAVTFSFIGVRLARRLAGRALLTGAPISWSAVRPQRRHVAGSVVFGLGWAVSDSCPGPVATQLGQGIAWSLFTIAGIVIGITLHSRRERAGHGARVPARRPLRPRRPAVSAARSD
jgi:uncharacterized membrane protein YedE/YeeE